MWKGSKKGESGACSKTWSYILMSGRSAVSQILYNVFDSVLSEVQFSKQWSQTWLYGNFQKECCNIYFNFPPKFDWFRIQRSICIKFTCEYFSVFKNVWHVFLKPYIFPYLLIVYFCSVNLWISKFTLSLISSNEL